MSNDPLREQHGPGAKPEYGVMIPLHKVWDFLKKRKKKKKTVRRKK